jgi:type VI secretion system protein ImpG
MSDDFLSYYEQELSFVREMGDEFARKYPKVAGRLRLETDRSEDPHVERLIEAFAFLCGRVHKKIDDDLPEITESFFQILNPQFISPVPSMSIAAFTPQLSSVSASGYQVPADTELFSLQKSVPQCQFRSRYPVTFWPVELVSASIRDPRRPLPQSQQALVLQLSCANGLTMSQLQWSSLRFFLNGQGQHVQHLYEMIFNHASHVEFVGRSAQGVPLELLQAGSAILPVGFTPQEAMLPAGDKSFPAHALLTEYFCFPEKFLFFDVAGLDKLPARGFQESLEIWIYFDRPVKQGMVVNAEMFSLNATPVVNLFTRTAEPLRIDRTRNEYRLIPDLRRQDSTEVFSVDSVSSHRLSRQDSREYRPFYSLQHHREDDTVYWLTRRVPSGRYGDEGTDVFLSFSDIGFNGTPPDAETVMVKVTCTNRDQPARMKFDDPAGDFETEIVAAVSSIRCLVKPTRSRRQALGGALQWQLVSGLALNYLSLVSGGEEALKEILRIYDFENSPSTRQQINGIVSLKSGYTTKRLGRSFCRGVQVEITFDEEKFVGSGLYLFACILERFIGQYVSVNSFTQVIVKTQQRKETYKAWPPRNGDRTLI